MSMHLRGSSDMMRNEDEGWWTSRTGLEQKLIIFSTILFIVCFSLTITVIVYKKNCTCTSECTIAPPLDTTTAVTGETTVTGDTTPSSDTSVSPSVETSPATTPPASSSSDSSSTSVITPETTSDASSKPSEEPKEKASLQNSKSSPLMSLLKEADRVNGILEKRKQDEKLTGA